MNADYAFGLHRNTVIAPIIGVQSDTLRPADFPGLTFNRKFAEDFGGFVFRSSPLRQLLFNVTYIRSGTVNVVVPAGQLPNECDETSITAVVPYMSVKVQQFDNHYLKSNRQQHHAS